METLEGELLWKSGITVPSPIEGLRENLEGYLFTILVERGHAHFDDNYEVESNFLDKDETIGEVRLHFAHSTYGVRSVRVDPSRDDMMDEEDLAYHHETRTVHVEAYIY